MAGYWLAILAAGTWLLPAGTLYLSSTSIARAAPVPVPGATQGEFEITDLTSHLNSLLSNGAFTKPTGTASQFDVTGDGVPDEILVAPGPLLESTGYILVTDGASRQPLYKLKSPTNEFCFANHVGIVPDCDLDGSSELAVTSGVETGACVELRIRLYSGSTGDLLAILRWRRPIMSNVDPVVTIEVAGDVNFDQAINSTDVADALVVIGSTSENEPADLDLNGVVSVDDVMKVAAMVSEEAIAPRADILRENLAQIATVAVILPFPPFIPGEFQNSWYCWGVAGLLGVELALLVATTSGCSAATVTGPAAVVCWTGFACQLAAFIGNLNAWLHECFVPPQADVANGAQTVLNIVGGICAGVAQGIVNWRQILSWLEGLWRIL